MTTTAAPAVELADLACMRLADVLSGTGGGNAPTTLDALLRRLFDPDERELLTYSAFGSSL